MSHTARVPTMIRRGVAVLVAGFTVAAGPGGAAAQDAGFDVVVFEGLGLGHGVGLPLDGANHLAAEESASARDILDRFYPDTEIGREDGLVRFLVGTRDDLGNGFDVRLPEGGVVRDGRTRAVAPSFPIRVPSDGTVRISFDDDVFRAEVLGERSVSGTHEVTSTTGSTGDPAAETADDPDEDADEDAGEDAAFPGLAASPNTLWIEPRAGGPIVVERTERDGEVLTGGLHELVLEAERLHLVGEADVEAYLTGLSFMLDDTGLERAALEASVIAARTYALRAAASEPKIGRFHVFTDDRSFPFVGIGNADPAHVAAVEATAGRVVRHGGRPAATLVTASAGGRTGVPGEVFGGEGEAAPYLRSVDYPTAQEYRWQVEMGLDDVARQLGYDGQATSVAVGNRGPSGRPVELVVGGDAGEVSVAADAFHDALRLPSSRFRVTVEERTEAVPDRDDSPPFQEPPGTPLDGDVAVAAGAGAQADTDGGGVDLPPPYVLGSLAALALAMVLLLLSRLARAVAGRRDRRRSRRRAARAVAESRPPPAPAELEPEPAPAPEPEPEPAPEPEPEPVVEGPTWHNEPEWLAEILRDEEAPDLEVEDVDEHTLRRSVERMRRESEAGRERPLSDVLGWDDAPDWLDDEPPDDESNSGP